MTLRHALLRSTLLVMALAGFGGGVARAADSEPVPAQAPPTFSGRFPTDSGVINATQFGVKPGQDVTDALNALLNAHTYDGTPVGDIARKLAPRTIYLPAGVYYVHAPIVVGSSTLAIVGDGPTSTTIQMAPGVAAFADSTHPVAVLQTGNYTDTSARARCGGEANCGFANYIEDLGVSVGRNNPGAIGIRYDVANVGAMRRVLISAPETGTSGRYGLAFETSPGPGYVQDVTVRGFDYGVYLDAPAVNVITFSDLQVLRPRFAGILDVGKDIVLERFRSSAPVAIQTVKGTAAVTLIGGMLTGTGSAHDAVQMGAAGMFYARAVGVQGYGALLNVAGRRFVPTRVRDLVREWSDVPAQSGAARTNAWPGTKPGAFATLNLPIVRYEPPADTTTPSEWVNAASQIQDSDHGDFSLAIQRAIDLQPSVVYVPWGNYQLRTPITLHGRVRHLDLGFAGLVVPSGSHADLRVAGETGPVLVDQAATNLSVISSSQFPVVVRDIGLFGTATLTASAGSKGPLLIDDTGSHTQVSVQAGAHVYARSIDHSNTIWTNEGGTLWCLSCSNETDPAPFVTTGGGVTELLGVDMDKLFADGTRPVGDSTPTYAGQSMFQVSGLGSRVSYVANGAVRPGVSWGTILRDVSNVLAKIAVTGKSGVDFAPNKLSLPVYTTPAAQPTHAAHG